jgi:hypothetical protein
MQLQLSFKLEAGVGIIGLFGKPLLPHHEFPSALHPVPVPDAAECLCFSPPLDSILLSFLPARSSLLSFLASPLLLFHHHRPIERASLEFTRAPSPNEIDTLTIYGFRVQCTPAALLPVSASCCIQHPTSEGIYSFAAGLTAPLYRGGQRM